MFIHNLGAGFGIGNVLSREQEQCMGLLKRNGFFFIGGIIATGVLAWFLIDLLLRYGPT